VTIGARAGKEDITIKTVGDGSVQVEAQKALDPTAKIEGAPLQILALFAGKTSLKEARARGLRFEGDASVLRRFATS
jgi:hypothetical protein